MTLTVQHRAYLSSNKSYIRSAASGNSSRASTSNGLVAIMNKFSENVIKISKAMRELQSAPSRIYCWNSWKHSHSRECQLDPRDEKLRAAEKLNFESICIFLNNLFGDRKISNLKFLHEFLSKSWPELVFKNLFIENSSWHTFESKGSSSRKKRCLPRNFLSVSFSEKLSRLKLKHENNGKREENEWKLADSWICELVEFFFLYSRS